MTDSLIVTPDSLPALKLARQAVRTSDRQPTDGVYLLSGLDLGGVEHPVWVGCTRYRLLGGYSPTVEGLIGTLDVGARIDRAKRVDEETGKATIPSELSDLVDILTDGDSVEIPLVHPIPLEVLRATGFALSPPEGGETIDVPSSRSDVWKDPDDPKRKLDFPIGGRRVLPEEHAAPFKGKTLTRYTDTVWGFRTETTFGMLAEREPPEQEVA